MLNIHNFFLGRQWQLHIQQMINQCSGRLLFLGEAPWSFFRTNKRVNQVYVV